MRQRFPLVRCCTHPAALTVCATVAAFIIIANVVAETSDVCSATLTDDPDEHGDDRPLLKESSNPASDSQTSATNRKWATSHLERQVAEEQAAAIVGQKQQLAVATWHKLRIFWALWLPAQFLLQFKQGCTPDDAPDKRRG